MGTKSAQLQIRVSPEQKATLRRLAREAGMDVSSYVLARALPDARRRLGAVVDALSRSADHRYALADLNDLLTGMTLAGLREAVSVAPRGLGGLPPLLQNYVAAMVEQACGLRSAEAPSWTRAVPALETPYFAAPLKSLRLHLLRSAPVPFKRRNLFVDASVGARA